MDRGQFNPYEVLGVGREASLLEIARARRRLAKRYHPDVSRGDRAAEQMQSVNAAWELLSDPDRRAAWDRAASGPSASAWSPPMAWTEWAYGPVPAAGTSRPADGASGGHAGWFVLAGMSLLLALILVAGLVSALDGPSMPGRDSPVLQNNLDVPGER